VSVHPGVVQSAEAWVNKMTVIGPNALLSLAIRPKTDGDRERLLRGITALMAEDLTISMEIHASAAELVIGSTGELHLETIVDRLRRDFRVEASLSRPRVAYKETLGTEGESVLLEPVMRTEIMTPTDFVGDVIGDLMTRRGVIQTQDDCGRMQRVVARVPLSEMFGYASDLRSRTRGHGTVEMEFACYQQCDPDGNQDTGDDSRVRVPSKPLPTLLNSSVALPEPTDEN